MMEGSDDDEDMGQTSNLYPDVDHQQTYPWAGGSQRQLHHENVDPDLDAGNPGHSPQASASQEDDENSDKDGEFYTLQSDVENFQEDLRREKKNRTAKSKASRGEGKRGGKRGPRGPHKPVQPPLELSLLIEQAQEAFVDGDLDRAEDLSYEVIMKNDEIYDAHALLSGIYIERGEIRRGIIACLSAAHLRPRDPTIWSKCAGLILENQEEPRARNVKDAIYCYSQRIRAEGNDMEARFERALLVRELGLSRRATKEFEHLYSVMPYETTVIRQLAELYIDAGEIDKAKDLYEQYLSRGLDADDQQNGGFDWSDVNVYIELFGYQNEFEAGISELKALSRWLLGRETETYWNGIQDDDREWDIDDAPRRLEVPDFVPNQFERSSYGEGLPLELRVKLGIFRLKMGQGHLEEARAHFAWLEPQNEAPGSILFDYADLFREVGDALRDYGCFHEALTFYEPLQQVEDYPEMQYYPQMADCFRNLGLVVRAEQAYGRIIENDQKNIDARAQMAKMYEELGMSDKAFTYVSEVLLLTRQEQEAKKSARRRANARRTGPVDSFLPAPSSERQARSHKKKVRAKTVEEKNHNDARDDAMRMHKARLASLEDEMRAGDERACVEWMDSASALIQDFRSCKVFFPLDKYMKFLGYASHGGQRPRKSAVLDDMEQMAQRLQASLGEDEATPSSNKLPAPTEYREISFENWLDIFLEYALCLAKRGEVEDAYEIISAAQDANVFYHSHDAMFMIHLCWAVCALLAEDEKAICNISRWFMKEYQFTTDAYRLFAILNRLCKAPVSWYNSGPSQKYILRQVKAMDFALVDEEERGKHFGEKASYTARDEQDQPLINDDMDVALLMLYGHMLYVGTSYVNAFNYFFRAHSLDPDNPMISLFIGLSFLHQSLKRQCENRHYLIAQGFSFLQAYYEPRRDSPSLNERQEAEFNMARSYHLLGLGHLAIPYYEKVLQLSEQMQIDSPDMTSDHGIDAAYNLQNLYALSGNVELARELTEKHLVI